MWFGFLLALFIGGFVGTQIGLTYQFPTVLSMIIGAIVGGLLWKPREVAQVLAQSLGEFARELPSSPRDSLKTVGLIALRTFYFASTIFTFSLGAGIWLNGALTHSDPLTTLVWFLLSGLASCFLDAYGVMPSRVSQRIEVTLRNNPAGFPLFGFLLALGLPLMVFAGMLALLYKCAQFLICNIPMVAFRFAELAATQERLVVMTSCGMGVFVGNSQGSPILGGMAAMLVGTLVSQASKLYLKRAHFV